MNKRIVVMGMALAGAGVVLARCGASGGSTSPPIPPEPSIPAAPTNLVATPISQSEIALTWQDNSNNEDGFSIQRCSADWGQEEGCPPGKFIDGLASIGANVTAHSDRGIPWSLHAGDDYGYRVYARNHTGWSEFSNVAMVTVPVSGPPPAAPTDLTAGNLNERPFCLPLQYGEFCMPDWSFEIYWRDNSNDEDFYLIEECSEAGCYRGAMIAQASGSGLALGHWGGLAWCGTAWTVRVRAHNAGGYSAPTNTVTVTTLDHPFCQQSATQKP